MNTFGSSIFLQTILSILGKKYQHFVKFQNLIDFAYIQLTTNKPVWPLFNSDEDPEPDFDNPEKQCIKRFLDGSLTEEIWVSVKSSCIILFCCYF